MPDDKKIGFAIKGINLLNFKYSNPFIAVKDFDPKNSQVEARVNINYRWNIEANLFGVTVNFIYTHNPKEHNIELLNMTVLVDFFVEELNNHLTVRSSNDFEMDQGLETTFVSIAISTSRGILFAKTSDTPLNNFIFPLVNPSDLLVTKKIISESKLPQ
jgi:hypothetical protein